MLFSCTQCGKAPRIAFYDRETKGRSAKEHKNRRLSGEGKEDDFTFAKKHADRSRKEGSRSGEEEKGPSHLMQDATRIFLLSPAHLGGKRAKMLFNPRARFAVAEEIRRGKATLGEAFAFLSGLYFRGKLMYSRTFARPPAGIVGSLVITSSQGLMDATTPINLSFLQALSQTPIDERDPRYRQPLTASAARLSAGLPGDCEIVLLGSVATGKYVDVLLEVFGDRLFFPVDFIGRGDMSRGGLMLRSASARNELKYIALKDSVRRGRRAPRLGPQSPRPSIEIR